MPIHFSNYYVTCSDFDTDDSPQSVYQTHNMQCWLKQSVYTQQSSLLLCRALLCAVHTEQPAADYGLITELQGFQAQHLLLQPGQLVQPILQRHSAALAAARHRRGSAKP